MITSQKEKKSQSPISNKSNIEGYNQKIIFSKQEKIYIKEFSLTFQTYDLGYKFRINSWNVDQKNQEAQSKINIILKDEIEKKVQLKKDLKHNKYHHKNDNQI